MKHIIHRLRQPTYLASKYYFVPQIVAIFVAAPIIWMALDRTPPLVLHDGVITPSVVRAGETVADIRWRATFSGRDCPGTSQRELVDSKRGLWPQLMRSRQGVFKPDPDNPYEGTVTTPPLDIPDMKPGPATYRVTQRYYCNTLQWLLDWPIVKVSPYIKFEVEK